MKREKREKVGFDLIEKVSENPSLVHEMTLEELKKLCTELRIRISQVVTEKGGHLAPCLGAVELIVGAHRYFDLSKDRLVFDVGHQAYAHKLLTGRHKIFESIRSRGGVGGFPWPKESVYDVFRSGHASTAISSSLGIAEAYHQLRVKDRVIALVGDGSLTGGMAFEGLNNAGELKKNLIVLFNDNGMSISATVGALSNTFSKFRHHYISKQLRGGVTGLLRMIPKLGSKIEEVGQFIEMEGLKLLSPWQIFSSMGFQYYGPIDGHDLEEVVRAFEDVKDVEGPVLIHALTEKGRGYMPIGNETEIIYGPHAMSRKKKDIDLTHDKTWSEAFSDHLIAMAESNEKLLAITAAMPEGTGLDKFQEKYPERFYDVGIAEQHAMGFASGLAYGGMQPVFCVYSTFFQRAFDQFFHEFVLQDDISVLIGLDRAGLVGEDGASHQGIYDISYMRLFPKAVLMAAKDEKELKAMMDFAIKSKKIVAIRYPKQVVPHKDLFKDFQEAIQLGKPEIIMKIDKKTQKGKKLAIIAYGVEVETAYKVALRLEKEEIEICVVNARFAKPLNRDFYEKLSKEHDFLMTLEDGAKEGGFGQSIQSLLCNEDVKVYVYGVEDELVEHMSRFEQLKECELDEESVYKNVKSLLEN